MVKDIICKYNLTKDLPKDLNIIKLVDDESLKIVLRSEKGDEEYTLLFKNPIAFRSIDSSFLDKVWSEMDSNLEGNIIYEYMSSSFIEYIMDMSLGIYQDYKIRHFAIYGGEVAIDVLSVQEPEIIEGDYANFS